MGLLETQDLCKNFGGVAAVNSISVHIEKNEILGMIGPNGSGKTTFINLLTGIYEPSRGNIRFGGEDVTRLPSHRLKRKGISRTFQNLRVFQNVSVLYNILIGQHTSIDNSLWSIFLKPFKSQRRERAAEKKALEILEMADLQGRSEELAKNLPYGEQRLLEICRALASDPQLLLLDEPCAGMNPSEMNTLSRFLVNLKASGHTIFIVEHNMKFIMSLADRIVVLNTGQKFKEGLPAAIQNDPDVQEIYLGKEDDF